MHVLCSEGDYNQAGDKATHFKTTKQGKVGS